MRVVLDDGTTFELGETDATPTIGISDFSRRETDDFGVTTVVPRGFARRMSVKLIAPFDQVDALQRQLAALRATPARWVADDRYSWLDFRGFYKDFSIDLNVPPISYCTLTIEGLTATEDFTDPGSDPAPGDEPSKLMVLQPVVVGTNNLLATSVPENDYPEWAAGTTYPVGARVILASTHRIYESGSALNQGNDPAGASGKWTDIGPTNRWAMFDQALGSETSSASLIEVTLNVTAANAVALLNVKAASVRVTAPGYEVAKAPNADGTATFLDMPLTTGQVMVRITGLGQKAVGTMLVGKLVGLGHTESSPSASITDFSKKETDDFGDVTVVERAWAKRMSVKAVLRTDAIDLVANRIAAVRGRPALWIGADGIETLTIYGFFSDFSIAVDTMISRLSLTVEGLSTAGKIEPLRASVAWPDVLDPLGTKPQDNADVTSENTAKDTAAVGGVPTPDVLDRIQAARSAADAAKDLATGIIADVGGLIATYGDTASAAASASAAAQHEANSLTAEQNAEAARAGAEGAYTSAFTQAGNAETFRNQASTYAQNAAGAAGTASEQAGLAVTARQDAQTAAGAANTSAGTATAKADAAGQSASAAQTSQVRASSFALDAAGRATNNIVGRGSFDERGKGNWHSANEAQTYSVQDVGAGGFYVLQQVSRDAWEGDPVPGDWNGRRFRVSGNAAAFNAYVVYAGLQLTMADGSFQYPRIAIGGPHNGYQDFSGEIVLPATGVVAARPWTISDGVWNAADHGVNWRRLRIEDITAERRAQNYADAASTSFSNAEIKATEAGQYAQAASGSANTANVRAGAAETAATAASGSAAVATDKAAAASTSATLAATFSFGASNAVVSDFAAGLAGWSYGHNGPANQHVVGIDNVDFTVPGEHYVGILGFAQNGDWYVDEYSDWVAVQPGEFWQGSAWIASRECVCFVHLQWADGSGNYNGQGPVSPDVYNSHRGGSNLDGFRRVWTPPTPVPSNARFVRLVFRKGGWIANPANDLAWGMFMRPMLARAGEGQVGASPYVPRGGGKGLTNASARITTAQDTAVAAGQAAAQVQQNLNATAGDINAQVNIVAQVAARADDRTSGGRLSLEARSNTGRALMTIYSFDSNGNPQSGVDIIGDVTITGDLIVSGSIKSGKIDGPTFAQEGTSVWNGSISPGPGETIGIPFSLTLNPIQPRGRFHYELVVGYTTNGGQQLQSQHNGKTLYTNFAQDGGLFIRSYDDQGHTYVPRHGSHESVLATTIFGTTFIASISRGNIDTGIVNEGDYYSRTLSASHTVTSIRLNVLWVAI